MPVVVHLKNGAAPTVEAEVCQRCGETYFDLAAMEVLDAARSKPPRTKSTP